MGAYADVRDYISKKLGILPAADPREITEIVHKSQYAKDYFMSVQDIKNFRRKHVDPLVKKAKETWISC
jgi:hypothetical protein